MGLSGPRNRTKITADPNNNTWSRSTSRFGHRILTSQGWSPGDYLGVANAPHSSHYTAANASHIRITPKGDNLGLGAKKASGTRDETFGLSLLQGIFGRINGQSEEEVTKQEEVRRDVKLRLAVGVGGEKRWGGMRFVSGGFLVGDKIEEVVGEVSQVTGSYKATSVTDVASAVESGKEETMVAEKTKEKKSKRRKIEEVEEDVTERKSKKRRKAAVEESEPEEVPHDSSEDEETERKRRKAEKKQRKAEKKARKEEKRARKEAKKAKKLNEADSEDDSEKKKRKKKGTETELESSSSASETTPGITSRSQSGTPLPTILSGRQAVRQRYIHQKRMASMDPQALKEIFMIQAKG